MRANEFKEKKIACSLIHIIPFIYYIASTDCNIVTINTRLDDQQFFKQTNIRKGVEAIKSEYSYTLDPQILIDQLKIIINQRNPQT